MNIIIENTIEQYEMLFSMRGEREDYFRYTMMKPFERMWNAINVPLLAKQPQGYDVMMASRMLGYLDVNETETGVTALRSFKEIQALQTAARALNDCGAFIRQHHLKISADDLKFGLYIADPLRLEMQKGYCGFGGIPGFIHIAVYPNEYNIPRLPALIAHEFHHNLRFSYFDWDHGNVTVGDYLIIEGLAESFAKELYGADRLGPWVTSFDEEDLAYSIEVIKGSLDIKGFAEVSSYMFGDRLAKEQGYPPVGLSPFAGYAVGYRAVQRFMQLNQVSMAEATLLDTDEIIKNCGIF